MTQIIESRMMVATSGFLTMSISGMEPIYTAFCTTSLQYTYPLPMTNERVDFHGAFSFLGLATQ
jgi:hypothetical protein